MEIIKIAKNCIIPTENILYVTDYSSKNIIEAVKIKKNQGKSLNLSGRNRVSTVVFLKNDSVVLTNATLETILSRMKGDS